MALFEVEVTFDYGDRHWQNRWDVEATDIATVFGMAGFFKDAHIALLLDIYTLARVVVRPAGVSGAFFEQVYNLPGSKSPGGNVVLPLFNTVFIALETVLGGLPGKKYLRGFLLNTDLNPDSTIKAAELPGIAAAIGTLIANVAGAGGAIVLSNDKEVTDVSVQEAVQMRQLHRKRKKTV